MFGEVLERFIQNRPVAVMVRVLLESFLNADKMDRWFDTVRHAQYTKDILFSSIVGLMLHVVCNIRPSVHSAYRHSEIQASVVALYGKLQHLEPTTSQGLVRYIAGEAEALIHHLGGTNPICANLWGNGFKNIYSPSAITKSHPKNHFIFNWINRHSF